MERVAEEFGVGAEDGVYFQGRDFLSKGRPRHSRMRKSESVSARSQLVLSRAGRPRLIHSRRTRLMALYSG